MYKGIDYSRFYNKIKSVNEQQGVTDDQAIQDAISGQSYKTKKVEIDGKVAKNKKGEDITRQAKDGFNNDAHTSISTYRRGEGRKTETEPVIKPEAKKDKSTSEIVAKDKKPEMETSNQPPRNTKETTVTKKKKTYDELKAEAKVAKKSEREERRTSRKTKRSTKRNRRDIAKNKKKQEEIKDELAELTKEAEYFQSLGESRVLNFSQFSK